MNEQRGTLSDTRSLTSINNFSDRKLERAIATSHLAFENWRLKSVEERAPIVAAAVARLRQRVGDDIDLPRSESDIRPDVPDPHSELDGELLVFYVKAGRLNTTPFKLDEQRRSPSITGMQIGIIFSAETWTYSYDQLAHIIAPHLLAGNVFLFKHDSHTSAAAAEFERVWSEVGGPIGLCTNLNITHSQADSVIADERIKGLAFRGSAATRGALAPARPFAARPRPSASPPAGALTGPDISHAVRTIALLRSYKTGRFLRFALLTALLAARTEIDDDMPSYFPAPSEIRKVAAMGLRFAQALAEVGRGFRMPRLPEAHAPTAEDFLNHRRDRTGIGSANMLSASAAVL